VTEATILVCTRNRSDALGRGLHSIVEDSRDLDRELVVVDNGSTDETAEVIAAAAARAPFPVRYVLERTVGLSAARNRGVGEASGEFVLFTDDDTRVERGWSEALVRAFASPDIGAVGGRVLPAWPHPPPAWLTGLAVELLAVRDLGTETRQLGPGAMPVGANMAVRRALLEDPAFDVELGNRGTDVDGYEEVALMSRVMRTHRVVYAPNAVVHHHVDAGRLTRPAVRRAALQNGFGQARYEHLSGVGTSRLAAVSRSLQWGARATARRLRNNRGGSVGVQEAGWEFAFYRELGLHVGAATVERPGINAWLMRHLA
jgi:glycosyltransferase involved in cell wall biosynthesis